MTLLEVSLSCLHFSLMVSEGEVKSPYFFASVVSPGNVNYFACVYFCRIHKVPEYTRYQ